MAQHNFRLDQAPSGQQSIEGMVRHTYNNARKIDGLLGCDAVMRACHAYAKRRPDVPDHLVPKQVAELLTPGLKADGNEFCPPATRFN